MSSPVLNQAARVLKVVQTGVPADQALREALTQDRHFTDPAGRRAVSYAVFTYFRWWRWLEPKESLQKQLESALKLQARFDKDPAAIKAEALAARAVPEWLKDEMDLPADYLRQLQRAPTLWIRTKRGLETKVSADLGRCTPAAPSTLGSQLSAFAYSGITDLYRTEGFQSGSFEIQDLASQLVGHACNPQPGETWWDACAGEGGKTMHLSDLMQNKGLIWASDRSERRLAKLKERAARAQAFNLRLAPWDGTARLPTKTKFDGILLDAPCSGVGTWQRNPHARWTTTPKDVRELAAVQTRLLGHVAGSLKPGGRLVYAVCTLTRSETISVVDNFTSSHPEFVPDPVWIGIQKSEVGSTPDQPMPQPSDLRSPASALLLPHQLNANGMFIASWRKK